MKHTTIGLFAIIAIFSTDNTAFSQNRIRVNAEGNTPTGLAPHGQVTVQRLGGVRSDLIALHRSGFISLRSPGRIKNALKDSRLFTGNLRHYQADTTAFRSTFSKIRNRRASYSGGGTVINNPTALSNNRSRINSSVGRTFVLRGNPLVVTSPIEVGSNTTIWIDGKIEYRGPNFSRPLTNDFPIPTRGFFNCVNKNNIKIYGTKRGFVNCNIGGRKLWGVNFTNCTNSKVENITMLGCMDGLYVAGGRKNLFTGNFVSDCQFRGIWTKGGPGNRADGNRIISNLVARNNVDGIDVDGFASFATVENNVIFHLGIDGNSTRRNMVWSEVASHDIIFRENAGVHGRDFQTGMRENGTNRSENPPATRNNQWIRNRVFYAGSFPSTGVTGNQVNKVNYNSMTLRENVVYLDTRTFNRAALQRDFRFGNMHRNTSILNDVRYLVRP